MEEARVHVSVNPEAQASVDAFIEYRRIVGDDDILMTPREFEVSWSFSFCVLIAGLQSPCHSN